MSEKVTVTMEQVVLFDRVSTVILSQANNKKSKLVYAIQKVKTKIKKTIEEYQDKVLEKSLDLCAKDDDGFALETEKGGFKFKPKEQLELNRFTKEELLKEVEVDNYICQEEVNISMLDREALTPFIFNPITESDLEIEEETQG